MKISYFTKQLSGHSGLTSEEGLLIDPHEAARLIGFAFILDAAKAVSPLAVVSLVIVVEFDLPDCFKSAKVSDLKRKYKLNSLFHLEQCFPFIY